MRRIAATALLGLLAGCGGADKPVGAGEVRAAQRAATYPLYWVGPSFAGLALTGIVPGAGSVTFSYGTCRPSGDSGCAPPLQIQTSSICDRNALAVDLRPRASRRVRGAIVREYGDGDLALELGASSVTVFASAYGERALAALRTVAGPPHGDEALPRARYPRAYVVELRRVRDAHRRLGSVRAVRDALRISRSAVRVRLALARELGKRRLYRPAAEFTPGACRLEPAS